MDKIQAFKIIVEVCSTARLNMQENEALRQALEVVNGIINPQPKEEAKK